jgi:hypothetical protein
MILLRKNRTSDEVQHLYGDWLIIPTSAQNNVAGNNLGPSNEAASCPEHVIPTNAKLV